MKALDLEKPIYYDIKNQQPDIGKIYFYAKGPYETKYQFLSNEWFQTFYWIFKWYKWHL